MNERMELIIYREHTDIWPLGTTAQCPDTAGCLAARRQETRRSDVPSRVRWRSPELEGNNQWRPIPLSCTGLIASDRIQLRWSWPRDQDHIPHRTLHLDSTRPALTTNSQQIFKNRPSLHVNAHRPTARKADGQTDTQCQRVTDGRRDGRIYYS